MGLIDTTADLRITFANDNIGHLRPSGKAPELCCYAESESAERAAEPCQVYLKRILLLSPLQ